MTILTLLQWINAGIGGLGDENNARTPVINCYWVMKIRLDAGKISVFV